MRAGENVKTFVSVLFVFACCPLVQAGTVINASSSCEFAATFGAGPVFSQSSSVTLTSASSVIPQQISLTGLDCVTPYGSITLPSPSADFVRSNIDPAPGAVNISAIELDAVVQSADNTRYLVSGSMTVQFTTEETFVITGGNGAGIIHGQENVFEDETGPASFSFASAYPSQPSANSGPQNWTLAFAFGQPFTLASAGSVSLNLAQPGDGAGFQISDTILSITDQNGAPISSAVVTAVPEPRSVLLACSGLVFLFALRLRTLVSGAISSPRDAK